MPSLRQRKSYQMQEAGDGRQKVRCPGTRSGLLCLHVPRSGLSTGHGRRSDCSGDRDCGYGRGWCPLPSSWTPPSSGTVCGCFCATPGGREETQHLHHLALYGESMCWPCPGDPAQLPCPAAHATRDPPIVPCPMQARLTIQLYCEVTNRIECP